MMGPLGMKTKREARAQQKLCYRAGMRMGNGTWENTRRDKCLRPCFTGKIYMRVLRECLLLLNAESSSGTRRSRESKGGIDSGKGDYRWCFVAALLLGISLKDWMCCGNRESRKGLWQT